MTELLVVIGIISVLAGILLVAMRGVRVRAKYTQTESTMQSFMAACDSFQMEHDQYPGVIPETVLDQGGVSRPLSGTENALLHLMGGYRVRSPFDAPGSPAQLDFTNYGVAGDVNIIVITFANTGWQLKIDTNRIGEGPVINGTPYPPYFTPSEAELGVVKGQVPEDGTSECCRDYNAACPKHCMPDLLDAWGQPIIYLRRSRATGPLTGVGGGVPPQFLIRSMIPYTTSTGLGEFNRSQNRGGNYQDYSVLNAGFNVDETFAQIIRHPAFWDQLQPLDGTSRGAYVLISAGPDGVFFSRTDGPGTGTAPQDNIVTHPVFGHPKVVDEYDDIRRFGGG